MPIGRKLVHVGQEIGPRDRVYAAQHFLRCASKTDLATHGTAARTQFYQVVALLQHLQVVLDEENGVACLHHGVKEVEDAFDVVEM